MSAFPIEFEKSGASSLIVFEAIKFASSVSSFFDLEGSMIKSVEQSFRQFGSIQLPYHNINKYNSSIYILVKSLKKIWNIKSL